jgi:glutaredoxin 3
MRESWRIRMQRIFVAFIVMFFLGMSGSGISAQTKSYGDIDVILYTTSWCPYCSKARDLLKSMGVSLTEYDIEADRSKREEMLKKSGGSRGVPFTDVEGIMIRGYNPGEIKRAIEKKRE